MTFPSSQPPVPAVVGRLAGGRSVHAVWVNEEGGATFRVGSDIPGREFIKVANANTADFAGEARRLRWASHHLPVPRVLGFGVERVCVATYRRAARAVRGTPTLAGTTRRGGASDRCAWASRRRSISWWSATVTRARPTR